MPLWRDPRLRLRDARRLSRLTSGQFFLPSHASSSGEGIQKTTNLSICGKVGFISLLSTTVSYATYNYTNHFSS